MADESVSPRLGLEVPDHETGVERTRRQLLGIGTEVERSDGIAVSLELSIQHGVLLIQSK